MSHFPDNVLKSIHRSLTLTLVIGALIYNHSFVNLLLAVIYNILTPPFPFDRISIKLLYINDKTNAFMSCLFINYSTYIPDVHSCCKIVEQKKCIFYSLQCFFFFIILTSPFLFIISFFFTCVWFNQIFNIIERFNISEYFCY